jgi:hypothetical protein
MTSYLAHLENESSDVACEQKDMRPEAARTMLRECNNRRQACEAIREIVANLLGCEEMALFRVNQKNGGLSLFWSFGIKPNTPYLPESIHDSALSGLLSGEAIVNDDCVAGLDKNPSAFVPIHFRESTAGILVLVRMLPHKTKIDALDRTLLAVLSSEAGKPLFAQRAKSRARRDKKR